MKVFFCIFTAADNDLYKSWPAIAWIICVSWALVEIILNKMTASSAFLQHKKKRYFTKQFDGRFGEAFLVLADAVVGPEVRGLSQADVQVQVSLVHVEVLRWHQVFVLHFYKK